MRAALLILACAAVSAATAVSVLRASGPATGQLDSDIEAARVELSEVNREIGRYDGGLILIEVQLRAAILKNTIAMLEQKRDSFLRGITIVYHDPLVRLAVRDPESEGELRRAEADASAAHSDAEQYSGGLIQTMALMREATAKANMASIEQRIELARAGIALPTIGAAARPQPQSPGKPVADKDAL